MTLSPRIALLACLGLTALACDSGKKEDAKQAKKTDTKDAKKAEQTDTKDAEQAEKAEAKVPDAAAMKEHFAQATAVRDAIIAGDLEGAAEPAQWLAQQTSYDSMPDPWKAHLQDMRNAGQLVVDGTDLAAKARATAQLAAACGTCHTALGKKPEWKDASQDVADSGKSAHMAKHLLAAEQLWQGLAGPSDEAWQAGVLVLGDAPLAPEGMKDDATPGDEVAALATKVHELGHKGAEVKDASQRAELYGEFLATCAACHQAVKAPTAG